MAETVLLTVKIYALAAAISLAVAAVIKLVVSAMDGRAAPAKAASQEPAPGTRALPEAEVAAISAAVYAVIGRHRIVRIGDRSQGAAWTAEGRATHHGSHNVARRSAPGKSPKPRR